MRSKLFGRLMSFTLSATVALTSGIPALAYDGGGGDLPEDEEEIQLLEEMRRLGLILMLLKRLLRTRKSSLQSKKMKQSLNFMKTRDLKY